MALRSALATSLGCLEDGQYLILQTRGTTNYYVQFAAGGADGLRAEAVSNRFLEGWQRLDSTAEARLRRIGWRPPTDIGDGPVNWWRHFDAPVLADQVAELAVTTLAKAYDIARPAELAYRAFSRSGEEILLPTLGLERVGRPAPEPTLAERVDATLRSWLGVDEVIYDNDGDAPIRCGDTMVFVRSVTDPGFVAVFSPMLSGVAKTSGLLDAVNDINAEARFARAAVTPGGVTIAAEVEPGAGLEASLMRACDAVGWIANHWGPVLQCRFGGITCFGEPAPAPPASGCGLYL